MSARFIGLAIVSAALTIFGQQASVEEGRNLLKQEKFDDARKQFETVLAATPDDHDALIGLGRALLGTGNLEKAQATFERVLSRVPKDVEATSALGLTALAQADRIHAGGPTTPAAQSRYADAARLFEETTAAQPNNVEAWLQLGRARVGLDDLRGAAQALEHAVSLAPNDVSANLRLGELYSLRQSEYSKAIAPLQTVLRAVPENVDARRALAHALAGQGRTADAIAEFRRVIKAQPADDATWKELWDIYAGKGKYDEARKLYRSIVEDDPKNAYAHYQLAFVAYTEKKFPQAIDLFQKTLELNPKFDAVERFLGECYLAQGDFSNASNHYLAAIQINADNKEAYDGLAAVAQELAKQKKYDEALDIFNKALAVRPKDALLQANLALTYKDMGRIDEAIQTYEKALALGPADSQTLNDLGLLYEGKRQFDKAIDCYRKAEAIDGNLDAAENLGVVFLKFGNYDKALAEFKKVVEKDPTRERASALYSESRRLKVENIGH
ncbi:MAG: tetratricopeptide repeat protein [Planctomycetes bacterium]|nr:tetratricopeptide repeat protein [Planctomycetota bacterium]MBI3844666.1 tetratricopeptide repeat protein [Planctomycetota bacterium]